MKTLFTRILLTAALVLVPLAAQTPKGGAAPKAKQEVPMSERCIGKTQDGDQCKRKAAEGSKYCWQHDPNRKAKAKKKAV